MAFDEHFITVKAFTTTSEWQLKAGFVQQAPSRLKQIQREKSPQSNNDSQNQREGIEFTPIQKDEGKYILSKSTNTVEELSKSIKTVEDMSEIAAEEAGDKSRRAAAADDTRPKKEKETSSKSLKYTRPAEKTS